MMTTDLDPEGLTRRLREAIAADGRTNYALAKAAKMEPDIIDRFIGGKDVYLSTAAKLAAVLGLDLVPSKRIRKRGTTTAK
jgi:hypothetical protein